MYVQPRERERAHVRVQMKNGFYNKLHIISWIEMNYCIKHDKIVNIYAYQRMK